MRYLPHTESDIRRMLEQIGVEDLDELFACIPEPLRLDRPLEMPAPLSEPELVSCVAGMAAANRVPGPGLLSFLGAGLYRHHIPAVINALASRGEFLTAYTPYQPEVSQGTLQAIFEYQTMISELLGVEVVNASMYDGATATVEAALMCLKLRGAASGVVAVSAAVHPQYREVLATYLGKKRIDLLPCHQGTTRTDALARAASSSPVVIVQQPNFFGCLEDIPAAADAVHEAGALLVVVTTEATAFGVVEPPGHQGADVVCGEGQSLGLPLSFGGPGLGLFGCRQAYLRSMPGRIVGETVDTRGQRGFVLTIATREQHIRRERATSNICTNHGLCALMVCIYLSLLGRSGIEELATLNLSAAAYLRKQAARTPGLSVAFPAPVFNEVSLSLRGRDAVALRDRLIEEGLLAGHPLASVDPALSDALLVNVTELHQKEDIDLLLSKLAG